MLVSVSRESIVLPGGRKVMVRESLLLGIPNILTEPGGVVSTRQENKTTHHCADGTALPIIIYSIINPQCMRLWSALHS